MKAIIIPEAVLDKKFRDLAKRVDVWRQISAGKPELLVQHLELELGRLLNDLKEAQ